MGLPPPLPEVLQVALLAEPHPDRGRAEALRAGRAVTELHLAEPLDALAPGLGPKHGYILPGSLTSAAITADEGSEASPEHRMPEQGEDGGKGSDGDQGRPAQKIA